jgi:hypothetical protein
VEYERSVLPVGGVGVPGLLTNFVRAVSGAEALIAPAHEGLRSIELSTALYASGLGGKTVELSVGRAPHPRIARAVGRS